jgi:hypothetical protein
VLTPLELPNGQHALLRDPEMVPEKYRRPYERLRVKMGALTADIPETLPEKERERLAGLAVMTKAPELIDGLDDALMLALVEAWSYEVPVTLDGLLELPSKAIDTLKRKCRELGPKMMTNFEPTLDPASPTVPSSG